MDGRLQLPEALVPEGIRRRVQGADYDFEPERLEGEHLGIAKGLRDDRVTRVEVGEPGFLWWIGQAENVRR